jgi:hypothetical protein
MCLMPCRCCCLLLLLRLRVPAAVFVVAAAHDRQQLDTAVAAFTAVGKELGVI